MKKSSLPRLSSTKLEKLWEYFSKSGLRVYVQDIVVCFLVVFLILLMTRHTASYKDIPNLLEGEVASRTIRVGDTLEINDYAASALEREKLLRNVPRVFDYDPFAIDRAISEWKANVRSVRAIRASDLERTKIFAEKYSHVASFKSADIALLSKLGFSRGVELAINSTLGPLRDFKVVEQAEEARRGMEVFNLQTKKSELIKGRMLGTVISLDDVAPMLLNSRFYGNFWKDVTLRQRRTLVYLHSRLLVPNVTLNKKETETKRNEALGELRPLIKKVLKGEVVVRAGERVSKTQAEILRELRSRQQRALPWAEVLFEAIFGALCFALFIYFIRSQFPRLLENTKDNMLSVFLLLVSLATFKLTLVFMMDIIAERFDSVPAPFFLFLIPVATSAMIIRFLMKPQMAIVYSLIFGLGAAVLLESASLYGAYAVTACLSGAFFLRSCRSRNDLYRAGFFSALVCGTSAFFLVLSWGGGLPVNSDYIREIGNTGHNALYAAVWAFAGGFVGGFLASAITLVITPLFESLLDYTTDLKLIELSRMDNPLLRDLVLKAPGTYHHSILVGSLCEAACEAIGANPLLARVGAYYHDIGKIGRAEYFVENQSGGVSPHDNMKPQLSAKIIIAHVKEGKVMAEKAKLGRSIVDFIMQHHGTSLVSYFFNRAKQMAAQPGSDVDPEEIKEEDYRYPGPNPRSKEAVIMALADSCEAATRSLVEPTPARVEAMINKILTKAFDEGLLEDAEITLREIYLVGKSFNRILLGVHHQRVEYPGQEDQLPPPASKNSNDKKLLKSVK
ncbi:HDIG domain-containing protein [bacterium]|nr:HDIG domain-containing protein [bacterium]